MQSEGKRDCVAFEVETHAWRVAAVWRGCRGDTTRTSHRAHTHTPPRRAVSSAFLLLLLLLLLGVSVVPHGCAIPLLLPLLLPRGSAVL